jgi:4-hydroxy-tetrahydrodipicolinate synthase
MYAMKNISEAKGVYSIAVTPFDETGAVDLKSVDQMTDFYVECGANGLTILGILGEAQEMSEEEAITVTRRVLSRTKVPVIVGVSAPGFASMRTLARSAMELGA